MTVLPSVYLGSVEYFAHLLRDEEVVIDVGEHYIKRSERNRTQIMTANGVLPLTVHLRNANRPQTPMREVRIDYSKRWQHLHRSAIESAYRSSPYFDHYAPLLLPFYEERFEFLVDYNTRLTELLLRMAHIDRPLQIVDRYVEAADDDLDLRPKKRESSFECSPYYQLFGDRFAFVPNLSFLDLLFSEGPSATDVLTDCRL